MKRLGLPHHNPDQWEKTTNALCEVHWTPLNLIRAIDTIRTAVYDSVKPMPPENRFAGLLKFLGDPNHTAGNPELFWGGSMFNNHYLSSHLSGWFLAHTVPFMAGLILDIPQTFENDVLLLSINSDVSKQEVVLSKKQCATLLSCSFFCCFGSDSSFKRGVNFDNIFFSLNKDIKNNQNTAKLCMIMNYFERFRMKMYSASQDIVIRRLYLRNYMDKTAWCGVNKRLTKFTVDKSGM